MWGPLHPSTGCRQDHLTELLLQDGELLTSVHITWGWNIIYMAFTTNQRVLPHINTLDASSAENITFGRHIVYFSGSTFYDIYVDDLHSVCNLGTHFDLCY